MCTESCQNHRKHAAINILFYFNYLKFVYSFIYIYFCALYLWKPEPGIGSPGGRVLQSSGRQDTTFELLSYLSSSCFNYFNISPLCLFFSKVDIIEKKRILLKVDFAVFLFFLGLPFF